MATETLLVAFLVGVMTFAGPSVSAAAKDDASKKAETKKEKVAAPPTGKKVEKARGASGKAGKPKVPPPGSQDSNPKVPPPSGKSGKRVPPPSGKAGKPKVPPPGSKDSNPKVPPPSGKSGKRVPPPSGKAGKRVPPPSGKAGKRVPPPSGKAGKGTPPPGRKRGKPMVPPPSGDCPEGNLMQSGKMIKSFGAEHSIHSANDGKFVDEGKDFEGADAVRLKNKKSFVVFDLNSVRKLRYLALQADHNDEYRVEVSSDGKKWSAVWKAEAAAEDGMRLRTQEVDVKGRYVRLSPVKGDSKFAIAEFQAFCQKPDPWPPQASGGGGGGDPQPAPQPPGANPPQPHGKAGKKPGGKSNWWLLGLLWIPILGGAVFHHIRTPLPSVPSAKKDEE